MTLFNVTAGNNIPEEFNTVIETPMGNSSIHYRIDRIIGVLTVAGIEPTPVVYPCHCGFLPQTRTAQGTPLSVFLLAPATMLPGAVVRSRAIGLLDGADRDGGQKILAVPIAEICPLYAEVQSMADLPSTPLSGLLDLLAQYNGTGADEAPRVRDSASARAVVQQAAAAYQDYFNPRFT